MSKRIINWSASTRGGAAGPFMGIKLLEMLALVERMVREFGKGASVRETVRPFEPALRSIERLLIKESKAFRVAEHRAIHAAISRIRLAR